MEAQPVKGTGALLAVRCARGCRPAPLDTSGYGNHALVEKASCAQREHLTNDSDSEAAAECSPIPNRNSFSSFSELVDEPSDLPKVVIIASATLLVATIASTGFFTVVAQPGGGIYIVNKYTGSVSFCANALCRDAVTPATK